MSERTGPLSDIRILDLTQALAGPFGTALLGDLGADVIKVEPPRGDMSRGLPPRPPDGEGCDYGGYFASINRSKRSIVLDLKSPADRELLLRMAEKVDAVVENTRVGVMERMGLGYEVFRERNPAIVYAAVRGFGDPVPLGFEHRAQQGADVLVVFDEQNQLVHSRTLLRSRSDGGAVYQGRAKIGRKASRSIRGVSGSTGRPSTWSS